MGLRVSIVVPVFNEAATLEELLRRVVAVDFPKQLILVDDCSTDGSREILERLSAQGLAVLPGAQPRNENALTVLLQPKNQGKGAALRRGFAAATGDVVIAQDADLEYDPRDIPKVVQPIQDGIADVVYGSRFTGTPRRVLYFWHTVVNSGLTTFSNAVTDLNLTDMETCYKAFRREVLGRISIEEDRFGVEPELTAKVARLKVRVFEVPVSYSGRTYEEGKKIGWRDGVRAVWAVTKYGLLRR